MEWPEVSRRDSRAAVRQGTMARLRRLPALGAALHLPWTGTRGSLVSELCTRSRACIAFAVALPAQGVVARPVFPALHSLLARLCPLSLARSRTHADLVSRDRRSLGRGNAGAQPGQHR